VQEVAALPFSAWESFYVIVGSSAAALTGLQFVVIALIAEARGVGGANEIDAFGTPTVVHFCAALLISATLSAPWHSVASAATVLGISGLVGVIYVAIVTLRARRATAYTPVFEDWLWHSILPFVAYGIVVVDALFMLRDPIDALFCIGASALLLLFIGIHNAWDTVTYIATTRFSTSAKDVEPR
jgi:hypothetical protein